MRRRKWRTPEPAAGSDSKARRFAPVFIIDVSKGTRLSKQGAPPRDKWKRRPPKYSLASHAPKTRMAIRGTRCGKADKSKSHEMLHSLSPLCAGFTFHLPCDCTKMRDMIPFAGGVRNEWASDKSTAACYVRINGRFRPSGQWIIRPESGQVYELELGYFITDGSNI